MTDQLSLFDDQSPLTLIQPCKDGFKISHGVMAPESTHPHGGKAKWKLIKKVKSLQEALTDKE